MKRQPYTPCRLFYDSPRAVRVGDYLQSPAGSTYLVQAVRRATARTRDPVQRRCRKYLDCVRWPADEIPADAKVHPLHWYARKRR